MGECGRAAAGAARRPAARPPVAAADRREFAECRQPRRLPRRAAAQRGRAAHRLRVPGGGGGALRARRRRTPHGLRAAPLPHARRRRRAVRRHAARAAVPGARRPAADGRPVLRPGARAAASRLLGREQLPARRVRRAGQSGRAARGGRHARPGRCRPGRLARGELPGGGDGDERRRGAGPGGRQVGRATEVPEALPGRPAGRLPGPAAARLPQRGALDATAADEAGRVPGFAGVVRRLRQRRRRRAVRAPGSRLPRHSGRRRWLGGARRRRLRQRRGARRLQPRPRARPPTGRRALRQRRARLQRRREGELHPDRERRVRADGALADGRHAGAARRVPPARLLDLARRGLRGRRPGAAQRAVRRPAPARLQSADRDARGRRVLPALRRAPDVPPARRAAHDRRQVR